MSPPAQEHEDATQRLVYLFQLFKFDPEVARKYSMSICNFKDFL